VITSHDQTFLDNIVEETITIRRHELVYFKGTPGAMFIQERKERLNGERMQAALDKKKEHVENSIAQGKRTANKTGDENR
jgi:ATP-binding cassette subfamily F protein 3